MTHYNKNFYDNHRSGSYISAQEVFPVLFRYIQPKSAIDFGCGIGTWLKVLEAEHHIDDVVGMDGDYVSQDQLLIDKNKFLPFDLTKTYKGNRKFDLAMSLEVGEHLPEQCSDNLVETLTNASDVVMFSAAIPGQDGTNHINEKYPEYWAEKFMRRGYIPVDCIRKEIWFNKKIEVWYRQNIILYIKAETFEAKYKNILGDQAAKTNKDFLTMIHPELFNFYSDKMKQLNSIVGYIKYRLYPLKKKLLK
jgi:hypothetical protein